MNKWCLQLFKALSVTNVTKQVLNHNKNIC